MNIVVEMSNYRWIGLLSLKP